MQVVKIEVFPASNGFFVHLYYNEGGVEGLPTGGVSASPISMTTYPPMQAGGRGMKVVTEVYENVERLFARLRELLVISPR